MGPELWLCLGLSDTLPRFASKRGQSKRTPELEGTSRGIRGCLGGVSMGALDAEEPLDAPGLRRRSFGIALKLALVELVVHGLEVVDVLTARLLKPAGRRSRNPEVCRLGPG